MTRSLPVLSSVLLSALLAAVLLPAAAAAGPSALPISIEERGDHVAVLLAGGRTSAERPQSRGDRLELPLDQPLPAMELKLEDPTLRKVELVGQPPLVRIQLRHGNDSTRLTAEMAQLRQQGDSLEILLPREPREVARARSAAAAAGAPGAGEASAGLAAPAAPSSAPAVSAPPSPAAPVAASSAAPAPAVPAADAAGAAAARAVSARAAPAPASASALDLDRGRGGSSSPLGTTMTLVALAGLAAVGWLWVRRRRASSGMFSPLEILAQVSVGPRARVVWLSAGRREMLISVSDKDVRVLGQWLADGTRTGEPTAAGPADESGETRLGRLDESGETRLGRLDESGEKRLGRLPGLRLRTSASLSGLLRLRDRQAASENGGAGDAAAAGQSADEPDAEWARQLVAATRRGALR